MRTTFPFLTFVLLVAGPVARPAHPLESENGGFTADDESPAFGTLELFSPVRDLETDLGRRLSIDGSPPVADFERAHVVGTWAYTGPHEGDIVGNLYARTGGRRVLAGRLKGIFEQSGDVRELAVKIIDRDGNAKAVLVGTYDRRRMRAKATLPANADVKLKGRFKVPFGRVGFVGTIRFGKGGFSGGN